MKGHHIRYSDAELRWLKANCTMVVGDWHRTFCAKFKRTDISVDNLKALRSRRKWKTGRTGCFEKGHLPANKGKKMPFNEGSARTQFKKGQLPHNYRGPGHERIDAREGYVILTVAEPNPWTGASTRPVLKHRWLWEKENGPVPKGHVLKCKDGDKTNCDPSNWQLVSRSMLPRLAGRWSVPYDTAPAELKPTIMAVAELENRIRQKSQEKR